MLIRVTSLSLILGGLLAAQTISVTVSPSTATLRVNETRTFAATVRGTTNTSVRWTATAGTITAEGLFTPPPAIPAGGTVTVRATSVADGTRVGSAVVTIQNPRPSITVLSPTAVNTGLPYTLRIGGTNFLPSSTVTLEGQPVTARFISSTELQVTATADNAPGNAIDVVVSNPDPGAVASNGRSVTVLNPVRVSLSPSTTTLRSGASISFRASFQFLPPSTSWSNTLTPTTTNPFTQLNPAMGLPVDGLEWFVDNIKGGNATVGTIDGTGRYSAPLAPPPAGRVEVKAVSTHDSRGVGLATVTLQNAVPTLVSATPAEPKTGVTTFTVNGLLFAPTAKLWVGSTELPTTFVNSGELRATATLTPIPGQMTTLRVVNPTPGGGESNRIVIKVENPTQMVSYATAVRFLEQASYGADPVSIARVQQIGPRAWLNEQFALPVTPLPDAAPPTPRTDGGFNQEGLGRLQTTWLTNALTAPDQLRHRVAFALHSILVVSGVDLGEHRQYVPYLRILHEGAFGNYRQLLERISLNPAMGRYLNALNNPKANPARNQVANENYARELLQLFTLGLVELNIDGTRKAGNPPTYSEAHVAELAKVFTGWTSAPIAGAAPRFRSPDNWDLPMIPIEEQHDLTQKAILPNVTLFPNRTARQDLTDALDAIFNHPNVGPFVSYRLIQRLVTSNPSPAYVERVARVFNSNRNGVRGDLRSVVEAILTDPDAGTSSTTYSELSADQGALREPHVMTLNMVRALAMQSNGNLTGVIRDAGQNLFFPASVFSYFSPFSRPGPEFQALNATTALYTVNLLYRLTSNSIGTAAQLDLAPWDQLANNSEALITAASNALGRGMITTNERSAILQAVNVQTSPRMKAITALYLVATSPSVLVKR